MPYIQTALLPIGTEQNIIHFTAVRLRVVGSGNLLMNLYSMDDIESLELYPMIMDPATNIQPTRLANFNQQRARFKMSTISIDEWFRVNRIILYIKEVASSYPG